MLAGDVLHPLWVTFRMPCGWHFAQLLGHFRNALWVTFWTPCVSLSECLVGDILNTLWVTFRMPCGWHFAHLVGDILHTLWVTFCTPCGWHFVHLVGDILHTLKVIFGMPCRWHFAGFCCCCFWFFVCLKVWRWPFEHFVCGFLKLEGGIFVTLEGDLLNVWGWFFELLLVTFCRPCGRVNCCRLSFFLHNFLARLADGRRFAGFRDS